jgi:intracellular septation protein A
MDNADNTRVKRHSSTTVKGLIINNILNLDFVLSVVIPIILFSAFSHYNMVLTGTVLAGIWSIAVILIQFLKSKKVNIFAAITAGIYTIGLIGTIISRDPKFFLASPIVTDLLLALVFLGSVFLGKPLIQIFAEYTVKDAFSDELRKKPMYKSAWTILTVAWGVLSVTQALLRVILLNSVSNQLYFGISTAYGNISTPLMLVISFWFPSWYWKRKKII